MTADMSKPAQLPLWRTFLVFLLPMMLSNILQALSGTINSIFLGQMIGVDAVAAATVFFPMMFFFIAFIIGLSMGSTVLIGQAFGAKNFDRVREVAGATFAIAVLGGLVIAVLGGTFTPQLMSLLRVPADIFDDATAYARIMLISMPVFFVFILYTSILRGVGDSMTPLWVLIFSTVTGLILTPAFITGWGGLPKLGVASAAVAALLSLIVALAWLFWFLLNRKDPLAPTPELLAHVRLDWKILKTVLRLGIPTGLQMVIMAIAELVLLGLVNAYGSNATAAYGATNQVMSYVQFPAMSIGITASILGAQAIGAGRIERLAAIMKTGLGMNLVLTGIGVIAVYLLSHTIISLFITEPDVVALTERLLHIVLWSMILFGWAVVFSGIMRASGTVWAPVFLNILAIALVEVPVATYLSERIGIDGIWIAYPCAFAAMLFLQAGYYAFIWRKRTITAIA